MKSVRDQGSTPILGHPVSNLFKFTRKIRTSKWAEYVKRKEDTEEPRTIYNIPYINGIIAYMQGEGKKL